MHRKVLETTNLGEEDFNYLDQRLEDELARLRIKTVYKSNGDFDHTHLYNVNVYCRDGITLVVQKTANHVNGEGYFRFILDSDTNDVEDLGNQLKKSLDKLYDKE